MYGVKYDWLIGDDEQPKDLPEGEEVPLANGGAVVLSHKPYVPPTFTGEIDDLGILEAPLD